MHRKSNEFQILEELKTCGNKVVEILKGSHEARLLRDAMPLRKSLEEVLKTEKGKSAKMHISELAWELEKIMLFLKDPRKLFRSKHLKKMRVDISALLNTIGWETSPKQES
jgi:hypothetical protein